MGRGLELWAVEETCEAGEGEFTSIIRIPVHRLRLIPQRLEETPVESVEEVAAGRTHRPPRLPAMHRLLRPVVGGRARAPVTGAEIVAELPPVGAAVLHDNHRLLE